MWAISVFFELSHGGSLSNLVQVRALSQLLRLRRACDYPTLAPGVFDAMEEHDDHLSEELRDFRDKWVDNEPDSSKVKAAMNIIRTYKGRLSVILWDFWLCLHLQVEHHLRLLCHSTDMIKRYVNDMIAAGRAVWLNLFKWRSCIRFKTIKCVAVLAEQYYESQFRSL